MAPTHLVQLVAEMAKRFDRAAHAEFAGNHDEHHEHIDAVATGLAGLFLNAPHEIPPVTATLGQLTPIVRPSDLRAACDFAQAEQQALSDSYSLVLHPDCHSWINEAADAHDADPASITAWLCIEPLTKPMRRAGNFPVSFELRRLASNPTWKDIEATAQVNERCSAALHQSSNDTRELIALLGPDWPTSGTTIHDALDALTGPDRTRGEELMARMPSVVTLTTAR